MTAQMIPPTEVSAAKIKEIFDGAFLDTAITDDGKLLVTEEGIKMFVSVDTDKQLVNYMLMFGFKQGASTKDKLELVNELNSKLVFLRAWTFDSGIVLDYALPYDGGLPLKQVFSAYQWLRNTAMAGLQQYDHKNIVP